MKHSYINLPQRPVRFAPKIQSRRMGGLKPFIVAAYKGDGGEPSTDEAKAAVEALTKEVKSYVESNDKLAKDLEASQKEAKAATEKLEKAEKEISEIKAASVTRDAEINKDREALNKLIAERQERKNQPFQGEQKTFGTVLKKAFEEAEDDIKKFERKEKKHLIIEVKDVADMTTGNVTGGTRYGSLMRPGIIENPKRRIHVRDLLPVGSIGPGTAYTYMRESGDGEGSIAATAETSTKPQIDLDLVENTVQIQTIAGWMRVTRKAMNNIPGFLSFLQSRLPEKLLRAEDQQLLYGTGVSPEISGILDAGNYVDGTTTPAKLVERIITDISLLEDTHEREATGIVMRPADYYSFFLNKADGSGEYDLPQGVQFVNGVLFILGVPVAPTTAVTAGDYIVGDFQLGAQLLIQEGMRLEFFEQDGTNVRENKITVRIEESIAFPIYGSNYFVKGAVPAP